MLIMRNTMCNGDSMFYSSYEVKVKPVSHSCPMLFTQTKGVHKVMTNFRCFYGVRYFSSRLLVSVAPSRGSATPGKMLPFSHGDIRRQGTDMGWLFELSAIHLFQRSMDFRYRSDTMLVYFIAEGTEGDTESAASPVGCIFPVYPISEAFSSCPE